MGKKREKRNRLKEDVINNEDIKQSSAWKLSEEFYNRPERFATSRYCCLMPVYARGGLTRTKK